MRNILRSILVILLKKIKVDVDIYILIDNNWQFFVRRRYQTIPNVGDILPIQYNDEWKNYELINVVRPTGRHNPILHVEERKNIKPTKADHIQAFSIVKWIRSLFNK